MNITSPLVFLKSYLYRKIAVRGKNVRIGKNFHVGPFSRIWAPKQLKIGNDVYVGRFSTIECNGSIGHGALIANMVGIIGRTDHAKDQVGTLIRYSSWAGHNEELMSSVDIGPDVWIGYGAIILAPVKIGQSAVIAAGAVVLHDVPPFCVVAGNPAKSIGKRFKSESEREAQTNFINQHFKMQ